MPVTNTSEITVSSGDRYRVEGNPKDVERLILDAARGSLMELAWMVDVDTGQELGINPDHVVLVRAVGTESAPPAALSRRVGAT